MTRTKDGFCLCCLDLKLIHARGLCASCYKWALEHDKLADYERVKLIAEDRIEDYHFLRDREGLSVARAAERMGITKSSLYRTLQRAGVKP
jgi:hypothetical protein